MLALNARIEAARAGGSVGAAFAVVASEMSDLASQTATVASDLQSESARLAGRIMTQLTSLNQHLEIMVKGEQLANAALTAVDIVDRNLYERTCDCRWWATDPALVAAARAANDPAGTSQRQAACAYASQRLGVILDNYTVYVDIALTDSTGRLIARGRPNLFSTEGVDFRQAKWFQEAMATTSGSQFGFESLHASPAVGGREVLVYSAAVREEGHSTGRPLGVLGVLFDWTPFAEQILRHTQRSEDGSPRRVVILEPSGRILADSSPQRQNRLEFSGMTDLLAGDKNHAVVEISGARSVVGHGRSPGFETYATGWHALVISQLAGLIGSKDGASQAA